MVFEKQTNQDFTIQDTSAKRVIPHPNRLHNLHGDLNAKKNHENSHEKDANPKTIDELLLENAAKEPIYSDLLTHLIQLGVVQIPQNQEDSVLEYIKNLDLELIDQKQQNLKNMLQEHQQQQQIFEKASEQNSEKIHASIFRFDMRNQKLAKIKYLQAKKYTTLLYILIWLTIIVSAWVYTKPLPAAFIMKELYV